jgi:hypothetical protein
MMVLSAPVGRVARSQRRYAPPLPETNPRATATRTVLRALRLSGTG